MCKTALERVKTSSYGAVERNTATDCTEGKLQSVLPMMGARGHSTCNTDTTVTC